MFELSLLGCETRTDLWLLGGVLYIRIKPETDTRVA